MLSMLMQFLCMVGCGIVLNAFSAEDEMINYAVATPHESIRRIQDRIHNGELNLAHDDKHGYLLAVLNMFCSACLTF